MKYCTKCGNELLDEAVICPKCGCSVENGQSKKIVEESNRSIAKKDLFTGFLLNMIAVIIPLILLGFLLVKNDGTSIIENIVSDIPEHSSGVRVSVGADISGNGMGIALIVGAGIFLLGFVVYFLKVKLLKTVFAYLYLVAAIADFVLFFFVWSAYILATCFLGSIALIPGILQICAGVKFIKGCKYYGR